MKHAVAKRLQLALVPLLCSLMCLMLRQTLAQQAKTPPLTIQTNVNRVLVPVVVRDKQGQSVLDLKQEDFRVFDNNKPRALSGFSVEMRAGARTSVPAPAGAAPSAAPVPPAAASLRFVVFLFDDMHMSAEELVPAKKAGEEAIAGVLSDHDIAAVVSTSGKTNSGLISDREKLQQAVAGLQSMALASSGTPDCPNIRYYQADLIENKHDSAATADALAQTRQCDPTLGTRGEGVADSLVRSAARRALMVGNQNTLATLAAIKEFVRRMAKLPGQRLLILVSPGFLTVSPEASGEESAVIDLAAQAGITVSALNARGLYSSAVSASDDTRARGVGEIGELRQGSASHDEVVMSSLADGTGGSFFHNSNDLGAGLKGLTAIPECVYILELPLDGVKADGTYHHLKVNVDRADVEIQARAGYFLAKPEKAQR
jgi:VWFA-related protein